MLPVRQKSSRAQQSGEASESDPLPTHEQLEKERKEKEKKKKQAEKAKQRRAEAKAAKIAEEAANREASTSMAPPVASTSAMPNSDSAMTSNQVREALVDLLPGALKEVMPSLLQQAQSTPPEWAAPPPTKRRRPLPPDHYHQKDFEEVSSQISSDDDDVEDTEEKIRRLVEKQVAKVALSQKSKSSMLGVRHEGKSSYTLTPQ